MGADKALLQFRGVPLLLRVVEAIRPVAHGDVLVVAARDQHLPDLGSRVRLLRDVAPGEGPLAAIDQGLRALPSEVTDVFVAATDLARIETAVVRRIVELLGDKDAAIPIWEGELQPLCAAYSRRITPKVGAMVAGGARSMKALLESIDVRTISREELLDGEGVAAADPKLTSLRDADTPEDLDALEE